MEDFEEAFKRAEAELLSEGYEVVNPAALGGVLPEWIGYEGYMQIDMFLLGMCGSIYMLKSWEKSAGANREYGYALASGMEVVFQEPQGTRDKRDAM